VGAERRGISLESPRVDLAEKPLGPGYSLEDTEIRDLCETWDFGEAADLWDWRDLWEACDFIEVYDPWVFQEVFKVFGSWASAWLERSSPDC
jgi:hypothetical protein